jgi:hypothetical protein
MVAAVACPLQRLRQFVKAHRAVAVGIELVEDVVGLREVGASGAERVFEFRFGDLDAELVAPDWLCAAISALMVSGDICEKPVEGEPVALPAAALPVRSKEAVELWPKPVKGAEDDFDGASDCSASSAEDTALRASNMAELQPTPPTAASQTLARSFSKPRATAGNPIKPAFAASRRRGPPGQ